MTTKSPDFSKPPGVPVADPETLSAPSDSLLDLTVKQALLDGLALWNSRKNRSANLHPLATRGLFNGTHGLENRELLAVLAENPLLRSGAIQKRQARWLRSLGHERALKVNTLRSHSLALLRGRAVENADVVRGWAYVTVHAAAHDVIAEAPDSELQSLGELDEVGCDVIEAMTTKVHGRMAESLTAQFANAETKRQSGDSRAAAEVFLHYATFELLKVMAQPGKPWATMKTLLEFTYPAINEYGDAAVWDTSDRVESFDAGPLPSSS